MGKETEVKTKNKDAIKEVSTIKELTGKINKLHSLIDTLKKDNLELESKILANAKVKVEKSVDYSSLKRILERKLGVGIGMLDFTEAMTEFESGVAKKDGNISIVG